METKRVVIIGSGMSGMALGVILGKAGYDVLILEKNNQIGGNLQVFSRNKRLFDASVHYIGGLQAGGNMNRIFAYLGIFGQLELIPMDAEGFDRIRLQNGKLFPLASGYENFERQLIKQFPYEVDGIAKIVAGIREFCTYFPLYNLVDDAPKTYVKNPEVLEVGAWEFLEQCTSNKELIQVILGSGPLYCGKREDTPFFVVALILNSYIEGSYKIKGGGAAINKAFLNVFKSLPVRILKRKEVVGADYDEIGNIRAVKCVDGTSYAADFVISTLHPQVTVDIFGADRFLKAYVNRIKALKNTVSGFMLHVQFRAQQIPYENANYYEYFTDKIWELEEEDLDTWPSVAYVTFSPDETNTWANSASIMCYLPMQHFDTWSTSRNTVSTPNSRGEDYELFKNELEQKVFNRILKRWPNFAEATEAMFSSTPLTYRDYLASPEGSMYGIQKDYKRAHSSVINSKTRIPNLFLSGQNLIFHGVLGASISALVTSFNFIDKDSFLKEV